MVFDLTRAIAGVGGGGRQTEISGGGGGKHNLYDDG